MCWTWLRSVTEQGSFRRSTACEIARAIARGSGSTTVQRGSIEAMPWRSLTSVAMKGTPLASASFMQFGQPSLSEVDRITSHARVSAGISSWFTSDAKISSTGSPSTDLATSIARRASRYLLIGSQGLSELNSIQQLSGLAPRPKCERFLRSSSVAGRNLCRSTGVGR